MNNLYTCDGKGGTYELLGTAKGAGTSSEAETLAVYRDTATGALYFRSLDDFTNRMKQLPPRVVERRKSLAHMQLPVDVQSAIEHAAVALSMADQAHEHLVGVLREHLPTRQG